MWSTKQSQLEFIDLSDNRISSLKELKNFEGIQSLRTLILHKSSNETNPMCADYSSYIAELLLLKEIPKVRIDGMTRKEIEKLSNSPKEL